jgi:hypothetical protein
MGFHKALPTGPDGNRVFQACGLLACDLGVLPGPGSLARTSLFSTAVSVKSKEPDGLAQAEWVVCGRCKTPVQ